MFHSPSSSDTSTIGVPMVAIFLGKEQEKRKEWQKQKLKQDNEQKKEATLVKVQLQVSGGSLHNSPRMSSCTFLGSRSGGSKESLVQEACSDTCSGTFLEGTCPSISGQIRPTNFLEKFLLSYNYVRDEKKMVIYFCLTHLIITVHGS